MVLTADFIDLQKNICSTDLFQIQTPPVSLVRAASYRVRFHLVTTLWSTGFKNSNPTFKFTPTIMEGTIWNCKLSSLKAGRYCLMIRSPEETRHSSWAGLHFKMRADINATPAPSLETRSHLFHSKFTVWQTHKQQNANSCWLLF